MKTSTTTSECEQWFSLSLQEVTKTFGVNRTTIIEIINEGIVSMPSQQPDDWQFDNDAFSRIRTTLKLHQDLGINWAGAALVLELMEEVQRLKQLLR